MYKFKQQNSNILFSNTEQAYADFADYDFEVKDGTCKDCSKIYWHAHTGIQVLIVIDGRGYYQEKGKAIQMLSEGDVVFILPNVEHWHSADLCNEFTDIVVPGFGRNEIVTWLQRRIV